jgi:cystathionine beta-lyase family protein involved in aluminum resistance
VFEYDTDFWKLARQAEDSCRDQFNAIDEILAANQQKVITAFINRRVSTQHLSGTTGYGYGDAGREVIDRVFSDVFGTRSALVRHQFVSGTHAIAVCLFAILRPGDKLVCATGKPYDSLEEVIGLKGAGGGSLADFKIKHAEVEWKDGACDHQALIKACRNAKAVYIQRSRGYSARTSLDLIQTDKIIDLIKQINKNAITIVDNCYCEFVQTEEPTNADLIVGSLIKNPGGGIARTGGYIAGLQHLVELCSNRLTAPGIGGEVGCSLNQNREILLGLFMAPQAVANAQKTAVFCAALFERLGFDVSPKATEPRTDIVQSIRLGSKEKLSRFCSGVQASSPIDSFANPEEWAMPGYRDNIIMAAGNFVSGSTIESSADGPMREPYTAFYQGGLNFTSGKLCILEAAWRTIH